MLKIKDNVDLKELEKYGFEKDMDNNYATNTYKKFDDNYFHDNDIVIDKDTRKIYLDVYEAYEDKLGLYSFDNLYDLIKADLVEKVETEEEE